MNSSFNSQIFENASVISSLLQTALDNLVDGLLIVTASGHILQSNAVANQVCRSLALTDELETCRSYIPRLLWSVCHPIFKNMANGIETHLGLEVDVTDAQQQLIRVRIQPLNLKVQQEDCLLLILEDHQQARRRRAIADGKRYGLTPREVDVWELRLRNLSYYEIANILFITENTVKKHMKSILAKRRVHGDDGRYYGAIAS